MEAVRFLCPQCNERKPFADMSKASRRKNGLHGWCKACMTDPHSFDSKCNGKEAFQTHALALRAARRKQDSGRHPYFCSFCKHWHVGTAIATHISRRRKLSFIERALRKIVGEEA